MTSVTPSGGDSCSVIMDTGLPCGRFDMSGRSGFCRGHYRRRYDGKPAMGRPFLRVTPQAAIPPPPPAYRWGDVPEPGARCPVIMDVTSSACGRELYGRTGLCGGHYQRRCDDSPMSKPFLGTETRDESGALVKRCSRCEEFKHWDEFHKITKTGAPRSECKECAARLYRAKYHEDEAMRRTHSAAMRSGHLRRTFNISPSDYKLMMDSQSGACAICEKPSDISENLCVDHDHSCCPTNGSCGGCIRGLLCRNHNQALGKFDDDPLLLVNAARYLLTGGTAGRIAPNEELMLRAAKLLLPTGWAIVECKERKALDA